jgi:hypothetical protein
LLPKQLLTAQVTSVVKLLCYSRRGASQCPFGSPFDNLQRTFRAFPTFPAPPIHFRTTFTLTFPLTSPPSASVRPVSTDDPDPARHTWAQPLCANACTLLCVSPSTSECAAIAEAAALGALKPHSLPGGPRPGPTGAQDRARRSALGAACHTLARMMEAYEVVVGSGDAPSPQAPLPRLATMRLAGSVLTPLLGKLAAAVAPPLRLLQRALQVRASCVVPLCHAYKGTCLLCQQWAVGWAVL